jgi:5'-3' exoribonuclease 1
MIPTFVSCEKKSLSVERPRKTRGELFRLRLQLQLMAFREYLDLEFSTIAHAIPFEYDLERIIDDFILMSIFVGNDFLPHLPDLHINEGALERIWTIYKGILPKAGKLESNHN